MYWGVTPALDFQELYKSHCKPPKEYNILLVGGADARHILKTISKCYCHEPIQINFYVVEACMELIARQLLLVNIALEPAESLGLMFKTKLFMELYGNTLVRPIVAGYLTSKSKYLVNMITNLEYCNEMMKIVNLNELKYKERDYLEILFKYWSSSDKFPICELWDRRLRQSLGVRYDSRTGAFDWDLYMRLHPTGAKQICPQEYKHWRETGVAFTWLESEVSKPNRTLVSGAVPSGEKFVHHGYLGDITSGPFYAYGLYCKDKEMLKEVNHMNINRATDISEYNITEMFYEILNNSECNLKMNSNLKMGTVVVDLPNKRIVEGDEGVNIRRMEDSEKKCIDVNNVNINFISYTKLDHVTYMKKFSKLFNIIYYSNIFVDKINPNIINDISSLNCLILIENQIFIPTNRKEQLEEFLTKIKSKFQSIQAAELPFNPTSDCYAMYVTE